MRAARRSVIENRSARHGVHAFTDDAAAQRRQTLEDSRAVERTLARPDRVPPAAGPPPITCMRAPPRTGAVGTGALPDAGIINPGS